MIFHLFFISSSSSTSACSPSLPWHTFLTVFFDFLVAKGRGKKTVGL